MGGDILPLLMLRRNESLQGRCVYVHTKTSKLFFFPTVVPLGPNESEK